MSKPKEVSGDTGVYLNDIRGTADLLKEEVERLEGELFDTDDKVTDPKAFEELVDDIARKIYEQYMRLQEVTAK